MTSSPTKTQRNIDQLQGDLEHWETIRDNTELRLRKLEEQKAGFGAYTPAPVEVEIDKATRELEDAAQRVADIRRQLEKLAQERVSPLKPFTTESPNVTESQGIPPIESADFRDTRFSQEGGQELLEKLVLETGKFEREKGKIDRAKRVIPALERYIERYEKGIDPIRCCVSIVIAYEKLRSLASEFELSGRESLRPLLRSKSQEIIDLIDNPCVDQLPEWGEPIEPPANRPPLALMSEETLRKYRDSCGAARQAVLELTRPESFDDAEHARALLRTLGANARMMQEAWRTPHGWLYAEIQSTIRYVDTILGE